MKKDATSIKVISFVLVLIVIWAGLIIIPGSSNREAGYDHVIVNSYEYEDGEYVESYPVKEEYCLHDEKSCYIYGCDYNPYPYIKENDIKKLAAKELKKSKKTHKLESSFFLGYADDLVGREELKFKTSRHVLYVEEGIAKVSKELDGMGRSFQGYVHDERYFNIKGVEATEKSYTATDEVDLRFSIAQSSEFPYSIQEDGHIMVCTFIDNPEKMVAPLRFAKAAWENHWYTPAALIDLTNSLVDMLWVPYWYVIGTVLLFVIAALATVFVLMTFYNAINDRKKKFEVRHELVYAVCAILLGMITVIVIMLPATIEMFLIEYGYDNHIMTYIFSGIWLIGGFVVARWLRSTERCEPEPNAEIINE